MKIIKLMGLIGLAIFSVESIQAAAFATEPINPFVAVFNEVVDVIKGDCDEKNLRAILNPTNLSDKVFANYKVYLEHKYIYNSSREGFNWPCRKKKWRIVITNTTLGGDFASEIVGLELLAKKLVEGLDISDDEKLRRNTLINTISREAADHFRTNYPDGDQVAIDFGPAPLDLAFVSLDDE
jgi:hypothetical protein